MASVRTFLRKNMDRNSIHKEIEATYTPFHRDGKTFLQIDTYGTQDREMPGKKSQSFQLDEIGAKILFDILKREFRF